MNREPFISVIIPIYGRLEFAKEAIKSVYGQRKINLASIEIIAVEEKLGNNLIRRKIKTLFPNVKIIINQDKEGPGGKRNTGLKYSKGDYISFLDADDQWEKEFLSSSLAKLKRQRTGGTVCLVNPYFESPYPLKEKIKVTLINTLRQLALVNSYVFNNGKLFKNCFWAGQVSHSLFDRKTLGKFKFDYKYRRGGEDWDLYIHVLKNSELSIVSKRLVRLRYDINSSTNQDINIFLKGQSYLNLLSNLPPIFKEGLGYKIFERYVNSIKTVNQ